MSLKIVQNQNIFFLFLLISLFGGTLGYQYLETLSLDGKKAISVLNPNRLNKYEPALKTVGNFLQDIHNQRDGKVCEKNALVFIQEGSDILNQGTSQLVCSKELHRQIDGVENASVIVKSKFESVVSPAEHQDLFFFLLLKGGRWQIQRITVQYPQAYQKQGSG